MTEDRKLDDPVATRQNPGNRLEVAPKDLLVAAGEPFDRKVRGAKVKLVAILKIQRNVKGQSGLSRNLRDCVQIGISVGLDPEPREFGPNRGERSMKTLQL